MKYSFPALLPPVVEKQPRSLSFPPEPPRSAMKPRSPRRQGCEAAKRTLDGIGGCKWRNKAPRGDAGGDDRANSPWWTEQGLKGGLGQGIVGRQLEPSAGRQAVRGPTAAPDGPAQSLFHHRMSRPSPSGGLRPALTWAGATVFNASKRPTTEAETAVFWSLEAALDPYT